MCSNSLKLKIYIIIRIFLESHLELMSDVLNQMLKGIFNYKLSFINKYVNDSSCLDSEGLKKFKMKLNPVKIYKVFSYKEKNDQKK